MSDTSVRSPRATLTVLGGALVLAGAVGWATLVIGGNTDASGRMGLVTGGAAFALVAVGWGRGVRGWLWGLAGALLLDAALLLHFWTRLGHLP